MSVTCNAPTLHMGYILQYFQCGFINTIVLMDFQHRTY